MDWSPQNTILGYLLELQSRLSSCPDVHVTVPQLEADDSCRFRLRVIKETILDVLDLSSSAAAFPEKFTTLVHRNFAVTANSLMTELELVQHDFSLAQECRTEAATLLLRVMNFKDRLGV